MSGNQRLDREFFTQSALTVAPALLGKILVCRNENIVHRNRITETEAYCGEEDLACHASHGRTPRTEAMYHIGGTLYIYLIYGIHWMLNIVTGPENNPQAVLIRGLEGICGPGRITRKLQIDRTFYGIDITQSQKIWIENDGLLPTVSVAPRIGVDYAGAWKDLPWRFFVDGK